jgi:hypothetical protein
VPSISPINPAQNLLFETQLSGTNPLDISISNGLPKKNLKNGPSKFFDLVGPVNLSICLGFVKYLYYLFVQLGVVFVFPIRILLLKLDLC